jgi:O-antigen/teichoic acid export membrane protein
MLLPGTARDREGLQMNAIAKLAKHKIAKNTSALISAQIASRVLSIFYVAVLARYVGTEGIGKISTATALNGLLVLVVGPGLNTLLVRDVAVDAKKAATYVSNMLFLRCLLGVPFILLTVAMAQEGRYPSDTVAIIHAYTVVYLFDALDGILASVFQAFERMEYEAGSQIVRDLINVSLSLLAIYLRQSLLTIVFISAIAQACKLLFMMALMYGRFVRPRLAISFRTSKTLLISSLPFGGLLILHTVQAQLGTLVLSLNHTADTVGIYSAAYSLIIMLLLLPSAFSTAIFPHFSRLYIQARHDLQHFYQICYKYLLVVGFPLGLGTMLVGDKVVLLIYGDEFEGSATVLRILAVFLFTVVGYSNGPLLNAAGKQRFFAWTQGLAVCANGILCLLLVPTWGPVGAAIAFVLPGIGTFFVHSIACHRLFGLSLPWLTMSKVLLATLLMGLAVSIALRSGVPWPVVVFIVAPSMYGLSILLLGIVKREELRVLAGAPSSSWIVEETART